MNSKKSVVLMDPFAIVADGISTLLRQKVYKFEITKNLIQLKNRLNENENNHINLTHVIMELFSEDDSLVDTINFIENFNKFYPKIKLTIHTSVLNFAFLSRVIDAKPHSLVSKYDDLQHLQNAIYSEFVYQSPKFQALKLDKMKYRSLKLNDIEWRILYYLENKYSISSIAGLTEKSVSTIKFYRRRIMEKLCHNTGSDSFQRERFLYG